MDPTLSMVLGVFMRWLHIVSAIAMVGSVLYARFVVAPAMASAELSERLVEKFRPLLYATIATILISGLYNYLSKPGYPPHYHMVIGVKFLFVLHIFATAVLYTLPEASEAKRLRRLTSLVISGLLVVLISAGLRSMTLAALMK